MNEVGEEVNLTHVCPPGFPELQQTHWGSRGLPLPCSVETISPLPGFISRRVLVLSASGFLWVGETSVRFYWFTDICYSTIFLLNSLPARVEWGSLSGGFVVSSSPTLVLGDFSD